MFGPLIWQRWRAYRASIGGPQQQRPSGGSSQPPAADRNDTRGSHQVLGLRPGATEAEIRAAHHRLMRTAHPDSGGSDGLRRALTLRATCCLGEPAQARDNVLRPARQRQTVSFYTWRCPRC